MFQNKLFKETTLLMVFSVTMYIYFHLKELFVLKNGIILAISKHDTLRPLGILFRPLDK